MCYPSAEDDQPEDTVEIPVIHHERRVYQPGELVPVSIQELDAAVLDEWLTFGQPPGAGLEFHVWRPVPPDAS